MLKKIISLLLLMVTLSFALQAQDMAKPDPEIRKLKIETVTKQMSLTQTQLQKFLPLYNRYCDELLVHRRAIKNLEKNANSNYTVEERQKLEEKMVEIKGRYKNDFLKIITAQQLAAMYKGEAEFKDQVLKRWKKERGR
jgi:Mg2+/Co2+ transporter CorB